MVTIIIFNFHKKPSKSNINKLQQDKLTLAMTIEHHKKIINQLQEQEQKVKWQIEREAKQIHN